MIVSVSRPDILNIAEGDSSHFGGNQAWYADEWHRMAGCGPASAANVTAYLALTKPGLRALYAGAEMRREEFAAHMEAMYGFVTPGNMGLNRPEMYARGVAEFAKSRGVSLREHVFEVHGNMHKNRPPVGELTAFVRAGLESDCPVAFLNLTKGRVKNLQGWHWITVTEAELDDTRLTACASDEGKRICFDLRLWYLSTRMRGGLIYFTES